MDASMEGSSHRPYYPKTGTYADLLCWHMDYWGTRPDGNTTNNGKPWDKIEFRQEAFGSKWVKETTRIGLDNWRGKKGAPNASYGETIENTLFGGNAIFDIWRSELEAARIASQGPDNNKRTVQFPEPPPIVAIKASIPRITSHFLGRESELDRLVSALISSEGAAAIMVQGGPGMGKTELTKAVARDKVVARRFGERRWFVPLQTAQSAAALQRAIMQAIGIDPSADFQAALDQLRGKQTLLILDNLETPWEFGRAETEAVLTDLRAVDSVCLLASFRGFDLVGDIRWDRYPVKGLSDKFAVKLFAVIAGDWATSDPHLVDFLDALGGIPLAIDLVARRAVGRTKLAPLWREWCKIGAEFAELIDLPEGPLTSLPHSLELSLRSPRLAKYPKALRMFSLLGCLPGGLCEEDRDVLIGEEAYNAEECLIKTGIAVERGNDRVDLLPPIREHAKRRYAPTDEQASLWPMHYTHLARDLVGRAFSYGGEETRNRIIPEIANIEAALQTAAQQPGMLTDAVSASAEFRRLMTMTGMGAVSTLQSVAAACNQAGDSLNEAKICVQIGIIAHERGDNTTSWTALEQGLAACHRIGNYDEADKIKGDCIYRMADIRLFSSRMDECRTLYLQAQEIYDAVGHARGQGDCAYRLADIAWRRRNFTEALDHISRAILFFRRADFHVGEANSAWLRARTTIDAEQFDVAVELVAAAANLYSNIGYKLGNAHCMKAEGDIALHRGKFSTAEALYNDAIRIYQEVKDDNDVGNCLLGISRIYRKMNDKLRAIELAKSALEIFDGTGMSECKGYCYEELAGLTDTETAENYAKKAFEAFSASGLEVHALRASRFLDQSDKSR